MDIKITCVFTLLFVAVLGVKEEAKQENDGEAVSSTNQFKSESPKLTYRDIVARNLQYCGGSNYCYAGQVCCPGNKCCEGGTSCCGAYCCPYSHHCCGGICCTGQCCSTHSCCPSGTVCAAGGSMCYGRKRTFISAIFAKDEEAMQIE